MTRGIVTKITKISTPPKITRYTVRFKYLSYIVLFLVTSDEKKAASQADSKDSVNIYI